MLKGFSPVKDRNGIPKILDADLVDGDIAVIRLVLNIFHERLMLFQQIIGFRAAQCPKDISFYLVVSSIELF